MVNGKKRKTFQEKRYNRKQDQDLDKAVICYCPRVCPDVMRVHLTFAYNYPQSVSGSIISTKILRGNSVFDPDISTLTLKAMGLTEWAAFYRRYRVIASEIKVRAMADEDGVPLSVLVVPLTTSTALTTQEQYKQAAYQKQRSIGTRNGKGQAFITHYKTTDQMRGMPYGGTRLNNELSSAIGGNPNQQWFWHVSLCSEDGATVYNGNLNVTIKYDVELYDRATLATSE